MAVLTSQRFSTVGLAPTLTAAAAGGDSFTNDGNTYLIVKNASGASITVTVNSQALCNFGFDHDMVVTVNAGATQQIGPFTTSRYNDASGQVHWTYSAVTSVTVGALTLG